jgi:hypothetical protein
VKLGAEGAPLACEIAHRVDTAEEAEAVHSFIEVTDLLCALGGDGFWRFGREGERGGDYAISIDNV